MLTGHKLAVLGALMLLLTAARAPMPIRMPAAVSCMGARCDACADFLVKDHRGIQIPLKPCFCVDFEGRDMALHFTGTDNGTVVFEKEISGESPYPVCYVPRVHDYLQICLTFQDVNSIGNSLQVCTTIQASIINTPPKVFANTNCFVADTQSNTLTYTASPRELKG
ncbi:hypothetical protein FOCC_FOCC012945 [Frankliniella occidentalis]|uniref:Uncharacterized protein LOC127750528 n=1 Tax=Frankliniella occidentalis TaxID=133901 RepID=A0A9C6X3E4_FRAOC|nr:uncharacterized protein LOC127750528 [Frankliniella occidentalis]KAE8741517.1 hypothetical protein FOCC_FOCC012945 [Frankliniella occidentalis]